MNLIDVMGLGTVALRGICRLNVRFGSNGVHRPEGEAQQIRFNFNFAAIVA